MYFNLGLFLQTRYNKKYRRRQESLRKSLFIQTHEMILSHNSKDSLFKMEHNIFSDMVISHTFAKCESNFC